MWTIEAASTPAPCEIARCDEGRDPTSMRPMPASMPSEDPDRVRRRAGSGPSTCRIGSVDVNEETWGVRRGEPERRGPSQVHRGHGLGRAVGRRPVTRRGASLRCVALPRVRVRRGVHVDGRTSRSFDAPSREDTPWGTRAPRTSTPTRSAPDTRWREITHLDRGGIRLAPPFGCLSGAVPPG